MPPGNARHRFFDDLMNRIAREHGHGLAVDLFQSTIGRDHASDDAATVEVLDDMAGEPRICTECRRFLSECECQEE
jgi:hypothetical protein